MILFNCSTDRFTNYFVVGLKARLTLINRSLTELSQEKSFKLNNTQIPCYINGNSKFDFSKKKLNNILFM